MGYSIEQLTKFKKYFVSLLNGLLIQDVIQNSKELTSYINLALDACNININIIVDNFYLYFKDYKKQIIMGDDSFINEENQKLLYEKLSTNKLLKNMNNSNFDFIFTTYNNFNDGNKKVIFKYLKLMIESLEN